MKFVEIYADTRGVATCRGPRCGRKILWATVVKTGRKMCFNDPEAAALKTRHEGGRLVETLDLDDNHWASCPDARSFK